MHNLEKEIPLNKIDDYRWRIPKSYQKGMRVDGIVYANEKLLRHAKSDEALQQVANVAHLPGIVKYSLAMPDLHWGYGFVIGGVAATDPRADGVVSPGGIGYDLNCGVRLIRTNIKASQLKGRTRNLVDRLFENIPCGVGSSGKIRLSIQEEQKMLEKGSRWAIERGTACLKISDSRKRTDVSRLQMLPPRANAPLSAGRINLAHSARGIIFWKCNW